MGRPVFACSPAVDGQIWEIIERAIDHIVFAEPNFGGTSVLSPVSRDAAFGQMMATAFMPSQGRGKAAALLRNLSITTKAWRLQIGNLDQAAAHLQKIVAPVTRRRAVKTLLAAGFAVPLVASFPMDGRFNIDKALAAAPNGSTS
eukprot:gene69195-94827_t